MSANNLNSKFPAQIKHIPILNTEPKANVLDFWVLDLYIHPIISHEMILFLP